MKKKTNPTQNLTVKIQSNDTKTHLTEDIKKKKLLVCDEHTKDFINFDIKIGNVNLPGGKSNLKETKPSPQNDTVTTMIHQLEALFRSTLKSSENIKKSIDIGDNSTISKNNSPTALIDFLKAEIKNVKIKNEILKLKCEFFEKIFYTTKNIIEVNCDENKISKLDDLISLKSKLISIFSQNNKFYYEKINFKVNSDNPFSFDDYNDNFINEKCLKVINEIDDGLNFLLKDINNFLTVVSPVNDTFFTALEKLQENILWTSKKIISFYLMSDNFVYDFRNKNSFYLLQDEHFISIEKKERIKKIESDFEEFLSHHMNKVMNSKFKKELLEKIALLANFYENYNIVLRTENGIIKGNAIASTSNMLSKLGTLGHLISNFLLFSEQSVSKLREVLLLLESSSLKNPDKVLWNFCQSEKNNIASFFEKYDEFSKSFYLVR